MKKYNSKDLEKQETIKKVGNIFFGCKSCNHEWNQDNMKEESPEWEGLKCPKCKSNNTVAI